MKKSFRNILFVCLTVAFIVPAAVWSMGTRAHAATVSPAALWRTTDSASELKANVATPEYAEVAAGVEVVSRAAASEIEFIEPIDVAGMSELIRLMPMPSYRGSLDFADFTVTLTDTVNPQIYMKIQLMVNQWWVWGTHVNVTTDSTRRLGYAWGSEDSLNELSTWGNEATFISFNGYTGGGNGDTPYPDVAHKPFSVWYDSAAKTVYSRTHAGQMTEVLRLDHSDAVGYGNEWRGFTENRARISVSANDLRGIQARYLILAVGGQSMAGETVADTVAPSLRVPFAELPKAQVNKEWRVPAATAVDSVDGDCAVTVEYKTPTGKTYTEITGGKFTPNEQGAYTVRFSAVDAAGNRAEKEMPITVAGSVPAPTITFDANPDTAVTVGESVVLPQYTVSGGSGVIDCRVEMMRLVDGERIDVSEGRFTPSISGNYLLTVTATCWLGNTGRALLLYTANYGDGPVLGGELNMFPFLIDGLTVELPQAEAYDVKRIAGGNVRAACTVTAQGTGEKSSVNRVLDSRIFTPTIAEFGEQVVLTYTFTAADDAKTVVAKTIPIRQKPEQLGGYFDTDNMTIGYSKDNMTFTASEIGDASALFGVPLDAEMALLRLRSVADKRNYGSVYVQFTDSADASISVRLTLSGRRGRDSTYVDYAGSRYAMTGTLLGDIEGGNALQFLFDNTDRTFTDVLGKKILTVDTLADGRAFTGFPSGSAYVSFGFTDVTGDAAIIAERVGNQTLYADYDPDDQTQLIAFTDYVRPHIRYDYALEISGSLGSYAYLPAARAFDELTPYMEVKLTVTSATNKVVLDNVDGMAENRFIIEEQGAYEVVYTARDAAGNRLRSGYTVSAQDDVAPTLLVKDRSLSASVGTKIILPKAIVQDNLTLTPRLYIYVYNGSSEVFDASEGTFTPTQAGRYTIRYVAFDDADNCTMRDAYLTVV